MSTFLKSNIESRFSSLVEGSHTTSLFQTTSLTGEGIYLEPHQSYNNSNITKSVIITIFRGTGELEFTEKEKHPLYLQIMGGDILIIPSGSSFTIVNVSQECLVLSQLTII